MTRTVVRDGQGARWSVRARRLRLGGRHPASHPVLDRGRLSAALAAGAPGQPAVLPGSVPALLAPDASDRGMAEVRGEIGAPVVGVTPPFEVLAAAWCLIADGVRHLRTPFSDRWRVELVARGRVRRWAHWEIDGAGPAVRAVAAVTAQMAAGRVPQPAGAVLVEVVDQRRATGHR